MKKPALQSKRVGVLQMAFLTQKLFGTFEKRALWAQFNSQTRLRQLIFRYRKKNENNEKKWKKKNKQFWDTSNLSSRK